MCLTVENYHVHYRRGKHVFYPTKCDNDSIFPSPSQIEVTNSQILLLLSRLRTQIGWEFGVLFGNLLEMVLNLKIQNYLVRIIIINLS